jgi:lipoate---protein ligase
MSKIVHLLHLKNTPIFDQLKIEEALLRSNDENWCLINEGSLPSIVMGISGKPREWIDIKKIQTAPLPLIKRYSGGGTVIVDDATLFVSFIFQKEMHDFPCYPEPILRWSEKFYKEALFIPEFHLLENDYVIGKHKCGGNALYIKKHRFVHHSTFLWDYKEKHMDYLLHPPKAPSYRETRSHSEFLCRLKDYLDSKSHFVSCIKNGLSTQYNVTETTLDEISSFLETPHRQTTEIFSLND